MKKFLLPLAWIVFACSADAAPNIVYILADDLGYGDVGCYGQKILKTPRIDQLASEGLKFTQHYSGSAMCAPTRSCLMTGQHTGHTRVRANGGGPLLDEDVTVAEVMKTAGYRTGVIGKWGVGEEGSSGVPNQQGFDFWFGYLNQTKAHHHYPEYLWRNDKKEFYPDNPTKRTHYSHDLFTDEALNFIRESADSKKDAPFFLYLAYTLVHVDLDVPEDSMKPWIGNIEETEPYGTSGGQHYIHQEKPHAAFAGMVSRLDRDVGRIADLIDELGLAEDTLIIFTSDNGPTSAGGADPDFFDGNGPFRGIKFNVFEGGIRCPMIARWPGKVEAESVTDHISAHWDVMPTFADLGGANKALPENIDGISFVPTLMAQGDAQKQHDYLYWETNGSGGQQAVRKGDWKAIRQGVAKKKDEAPIMLFNLENDIAEANDISAEHPEVIAEMLGIMTDGRSAPSSGKDHLYTVVTKKKKKK